MKALITKVEYVEMFNTTFGEMHSFLIHYDGKEGIYETKNENQTRFVADKEAEFTEFKIVNSKGEIFKLTPENGKTDYSKDLKRDKAKYPSMAMSYAKDLKCNGLYKSYSLKRLATMIHTDMMEIASSTK